MANKVLLIVACLCTIWVNSQNSTVSPYSFFGVGEFRQGSTVENQMMGGLQMYADSIHANLRNPAAYGSLKLTTYAGAISHNASRLKDVEDEQNASVTNLEYLVLGFPLAKNLGAGIGLQPFSSVGYNLSQTTTNSQGDTISNVFTGDGGLNKVFVSLGYKPTKNIAIGATGGYNFGTLEYSRRQTVQNFQFATLDERESRVNGFDVNFGVNYTPKITDKLTLFTHWGADVQVNLTSENSERFGSIDSDLGIEIEVNDVDLGALGLRETDIKVPTVFTYGLGIGEDKKWFVGAEYATQDLSDFSNIFLAQDNVTYQSASSFNIGGYYIPNYKALSNVLNRITYRAGFIYEQTGLVVENREIENLGITFGMGIPLGNGFSNVNLGVELGRQGTRANGLIVEDYLNLKLGLSLNDKWFVQRKIN